MDLVDNEAEPHMATWKPVVAPKPVAAPAPVVEMTQCPIPMRKASQLVADVMSGKGRSYARLPDLAIARGIQMPSVPAVAPVREEPEVYKGQGASEWRMLADVDNETALAMETA